MIRPTASHPAMSRSPEPPALDVPATTAVGDGEGELVRAIVGDADAVCVGVDEAVCVGGKVAVDEGDSDGDAVAVAVGDGLVVADGVGEAAAPDAGAHALEPSMPGAAAQTCRPLIQVLPSSAVRDSEARTNG